MNRIVMGLCVVGLLAFAGSAFGQTTAQSPAPATVGNPGALAYLEIQARSANRDTQLSALSQVQKIVAAGSLSPQVRTSVYRTVSALAYSGTVDPTITGMSVVNNYPEIRMAACQILGRLGGKRASNALLRVVSSDSNSTVLSQAIFELGIIGHNPSNSVSHAIVSAFRRQDAVMQDDNLAFVSLAAFGKLAKTNHGLTDPAVFDMISAIQAENYSGAVKAEASKLLGELQHLS